jgi:hypothetical protein
LLAPLARGQRISSAGSSPGARESCRPIVVLAIYFVAVVARIFRNVTAALEISVVGAKHRAPWRNRFLAWSLAVEDQFTRATFLYFPIAVRAQPFRA